MIVFKDIITGDELFTDAVNNFRLIEDGLIYEVPCKQITVRVGEIDDAMIGGNASQEEACESSDVPMISGLDVVLANRLVDAPPMNKATYKTFIKDYMKSLIPHVKEDRMDKFKSGMSKYVKAFITEWTTNAKELTDFSQEFYQGESMNPAGMLAPCKWIKNEKGDEEPFLYFFRDGILDEKV